MLLQRVLQGHISGDVESTKDSGLFDRRTASNVSMVATGIPKMTITITHTIDRINCDTMKRARAWLGSHGAACNFHDHRTAGIARHVRFRLADASA
jgi:hypothetical protein